MRPRAGPGRKDNIKTEMLFMNMRIAFSIQLAQGIVNMVLNIYFCYK